MRLHQRQERLPPLQAPIPTKMIVSASLASVLVRCYGLLLKQGDIGARAACWCAPIAYTARITCSEELVTGMGC